MQTTFKSLLLMMLCILPAVTTVQAALNLGKDIAHIGMLEAAKTRARQERKAISFLYTDKTSSCPLSNRAARVMIDELSDTVMVYVATYKDMPPNVRAVLSSKGRYIPKAAVFDSTLTTPIGMVTYEEVKAQGKDAFDIIKAKIKRERDEREAAARLVANAEMFEKHSKYEKAMELYEEIAAAGLDSGKQGVERLQQKREEGLAAAEAKLASKDYYDAVVILQQVISVFGEAYSEEAQKKLESLKNDPAANSEVAAEILFRKAKSKRSTALLRELLDAYPGTVAATKAQRILDR